jgi:glycine/D-amino acid oxidase-like deaminating enzyme
MHQTVFERQPPAPSAVDHALTGAAHSVFWLDDLGASPRYPALTGDVDADLVIVGGGFCGLWTALRAKERDPGRSVVLVEARRIGWAASGRNGGFAEASLTHGAENGQARWPDEMAQLDRLGEENLRGIVDTVRRYDMDCDLTEPGLLQVAVEEYQVTALRERAGAHATYLDASATRAHVDSPTYLAALRHDHGLALVHPAKLAVELARVASELGVRIFEDSPISALDRDAVGASVRTRGGARVRARRVALATNVFPSLLARTRLHTVPVYDYVLATEPLSSDQLAAIGWDGREGVSDSANQFHYYRMTADDRIVWGGYDAIYHYGRAVRSAYEDRPSSYRKLAAHFLTTFPQLEGVRFTHRWAGAIDTCTRFCAYFGTAHGDAVAYAAGFTGLGVAATRFAADVMLDRLDGEKTERTELEMVRRKPLPFPPEPLAAIGIHLTRWSLDRADHNSGRRNLLLKTLDALGLGFDS